MRNEDCKVNLDDFIGRAYPVIISQKNNRFHLFIPKLSLFVESDTLQEAFDLSVSEKKAYYERLAAIDSLHLIPSVDGNISFKDRIDLTKIFSERIVSFLLTLIFWVLIVLLAGHQINKAIRKMNESLGPTTPEQKEERLERFKEKLQVVAPYIKEVKKVFNE